MEKELEKLWATIQLCEEQGDFETAEDLYYNAYSPLAEAYCSEGLQ